MPNRQWLLQKRPDGPVTADCFRYHEEAAAAGKDAAKVKVRYELLLCAPTIRNWISGARNSLHNVVEVGQPVLAPAVGRITESTRAGWPMGARVFGLGSWQDEQWIDPSEGKFKLLRPDISPVQALGIAGPNSLTGYFGLLKVARPERGDCLVVSGGAGSVGSTVAQIGKLQGCKVIAICGGEEKRSWLTHACGIETTIDYKSEDVAARLDELAPTGIDIYFDNVGGELLPICVDRMRRWGRIVMCGQIADYDDGGRAVPTRLNMMRLIYGHVRVEGFLARDYEAQFDQATEDLLSWSCRGLLTQREDIRPGFTALPATFAALFRGDNRGTLIAKIADEEGRPV